MEAQLRQGFTRGEFEVANRIIAFRRRRIIGAQHEPRGQGAQEKREDSDCWAHVNDFVAVRLGFV